MTARVIRFRSGPAGLSAEPAEDRDGAPPTEPVVAILLAAAQEPDGHMVWTDGVRLRGSEADVVNAAWLASVLDGWSREVWAVPGEKPDQCGWVVRVVTGGRRSG